jgi:hypothetical protein
MFNSKIAGLFSSIETETTIAPAFYDEARQATNLFNQAVQEGWNREMDWLWLATKVSMDSQRIHALKQALQINPQSEMAKHALKWLQKHPGQPVKFS